MSDRWINAIIEVKVPLAIDVDASPEERTEAAVGAMDRIPLDVDMVATVRTELVEDGEPLEH